jgi:AcrR family transcriptional regulator
MPTVKRLTHAESKAQTQRRLIAAGREHFLRYGFSKSSAEKITKRAGYTRGALYSNFGDKEGLFLAVIREMRDKSMAGFSKLVTETSGDKLLQAIRQGNVNLLSTPEFMLRLEFELECLRNKSLRQRYVELENEILIESRELLRSMQEKCDIGSTFDPQDFIASLWSFQRGLVITQLLLEPTVTLKDTQRMMLTFFDLITAQSKSKTKAKVASRPRIRRD